MSDKKSLPVITIAREYNAGGRSIAKGLAEKLGINWYDQDLVKLTAKISGYSEEDIWAEGEELGSFEKLMEAFLDNSSFYTSSHDEIYKAQQDAVLELAKTPCIFVGRGANTILRRAGIETFDVLLYADRSVRIRRAMDEHPEMSEHDAKKYVEKRDLLRMNYHEKYYGETYEDHHDFSICFDTGKISYEKCVEILAGIIAGE